MAGKRKHDIETGSDAPKKKKKRAAQGLEPEVKLAEKRGEEDDYSRGGGSTSIPAEIREAREEADAEFEKGKGKKSGKKRGEGKKGLDNLDSRPVSDPEPHRKKKKHQEGDTPLPPRLDHLQSVEDHGLLSSVEPQKKKKKKDVILAPSTLTTSQIVEDHGLLSGAEPHRKKKKKKMKEATPIPPALNSSQMVEDGQKKKTKTKTKEKVNPTPPTLNSSQIVEDGQKKKKTKTKTKTKTKEEVNPTPPTLNLSQIVEDGQKRKKRKFTTILPASESLQAVEDCGPVTGSVMKTILKSQKLLADNGAEPDRKKKKKKKVTFQLPDRVEDKPSENELLEEETEFTDLGPKWATDNMRPGLVYGMYTPEEDELLKQAIFDYIQEQGWDREEGLEKILNSGRTEARGCWHVIRKCLPQRELKRIYARAHRLLDPGTLLGKWTNEEIQSLTELHYVHGNNWKKIGTIIGRDQASCKDKWRHLKYINSKSYKTGPWSEEEQQKLCKLVLKCLHVKAQLAKRGLITKGHSLVRDNINWEFIAEQMDGRSRLDCLKQWYSKMASPMVTTGEWSNGDDQRLLQRLMEEFPLSEELVEWGSLLKNRSGETCKKRWEQMQRTLGRGPEVRHLHFLEKLESVMKRFAPHLLDTEYDQKFAEDMQRADADEPEDMDM